MGKRLTELLQNYKTDNEIYHDLMQYRVREILLVATIYDAYILEEEDKLAEKIFGEYHQLNLSSAPRITSVSFGEEALEILTKRSFDMVILTMRIDEITPFELSGRIKDLNSSIPILLLLNDNSEIRLASEKKEQLQYFDKVFVWNGDAKIFLAMIKYIEDKINIVKDTRIGLVRVILMVEDSIRDYSTYLPVLYTEIMKQTQRIIIDEHLNEVKKLLRMRARPKVLMAENYEEALAICARYQEYLLAVVSDVKFSVNDQRDDSAGVKLVNVLRKRIKDLPILLQSADASNREKAEALGCVFIDKNAKNLSRELTEFIFNNLGFGDFIFRDAAGKMISSAASMAEFRDQLTTVPDETLEYHANRNHFSSWLMARGEIQIAKQLQPVQVSDFPDTAGLRQHLIELQQAVQDSKTRGRIIPFAESLVSKENHVIRLSEGALGGKGRGTAFLHMLIESCGLEDELPDVTVTIPQTSIIGTEEYDTFIEDNGLGWLIDSDLPFKEVKEHVLQGELSAPLKDTLTLFLKHQNDPLCVRSSGMFEDSLSQPFAGVYDTYLLPNNHPDPKVRQQFLEQAVKLVYASVFSESARAYFEAIDYKIGDEKMAVLLQKVVGTQYGQRFYPHFSGVAQSYNYYPVAYLKPEDGIAVIGFGLGKYVIDGERAHRFCPKYPRLDFISVEDQLKNTQTEFYALDMRHNPGQLVRGDDSTLARLNIAEAVADNTLSQCTSVWDQENQRLHSGNAAGPRIVNFANILKYDVFPLANVLDQVLDLIKGAMGTPVEIEFAVDLNTTEGGKPAFHILQMKPLLADWQDYSLDLTEVKHEELFIYSEHAMGNGLVDDLCDIVYVDPDTFDRSRTLEMTTELTAINAQLKAEKRRYILIGPGRWGSRDPWLGIPVNWAHISNAKIIVEAELADFAVDPSLGSHFFHNVTSMNVGYLDIPYNSSKAFLDWQWLRSCNVINRSEHFVHARTPKAIVAKMDGRQSISVLFKS